MILYLLYAIGGFVAVYFLREYRFTFYALALRSVKLLNDILTAEDDDKKLEMLTGSTNKLVASLGKSILLFCLAILAFIIPSSIYTYIISQSLDFTGVGSLYGIIALSVGASIPFFIPAKKSTEGYSELAMLLHRMVLNNYTIGLKLLKREVRQAEKQGLKTDQPFVIVSGLARAGTTSLMNHLMETGEFTSLNYANMPFLLSPNTWSRLYRPAKEQLKERSHKDGLKIGLESNEALEEYFLRHN